MKRLLLRMTTMVTCAGILGFGGWATADTGPGLYYVTPSWGHKIPTASRFLVLSDWNNEAVLDRETGLVWERQPVGVGDWRTAVTTCLKKTIGGRKGWRLPAIVELMSLVDANVPSPGPTLPPGHPFILARASSGTLWYSFFSATKSVTDDAFVWYVAFRTGGHGLKDLRDPCRKDDLWDYLSISVCGVDPAIDPPVIVPGVALSNTWCVRGPMNEEEY